MKNFKIWDLFKKDIIYIQNLSDKFKKFLVYYIILYIIIFYIEIIKVERILLFFLILLLLLLYKVIMELIITYLYENNNFKIYIKRNNNNLLKILQIFLFIQKWKNPLLLLLLYIDKLYFKFFRFFIYKFKANKIFNYTSYNLQKYFFLQYLILNLILGPLKFIFGFFYSVLLRWVEMPFSLFLITRSFSFILSVFIFSDLFSYIYNNLGVIYIYFLLIIFSLIIKHINRDFQFFKIQYMNNFISTDYLIFIRNHVTIFGNIILAISQYNINVLKTVYINTISSHLKVDIEESFYKHWEFYKRNSLLYTINIWKEIKNRPSLYIYMNLVHWITANTILQGPSSITNILYLKYKADKLNLILPNDIKEDLDYLYMVNVLRLKLLLFMLWDIDNYIENKNWNYIVCKYNKNLDSFNIESDRLIHDYTDFDNFKVEDKEKDLCFYDPEANMHFLNRLYLIIGVIPFIENPLKFPIYSDILCTYGDLMLNIISRLNNFHLSSEDILGITWIREEETADLDVEGVSLIENKIKDWIILFLKESRKEWLLISKEESIEKRNWRLLEELEKILINYEKKRG